MQAKLLAWYDAQGRTLPWRIRPEERAAGQVADPYAVWLSEIMLQQTTVPHATPYWQKFLAEFPTVIDLANADRDRVLTMWAGLGYYARARNLHKCAGVVRDEHDGEFPRTEAQLLKLPGIGPYTAATIAAICFDEATNIVDGNVERVISRIFKIEERLPKARPEYRRLAGTVAPQKRPGDYGQALMDLGATICTPRSPSCELCPWQDFCTAKTAGTQTDYPKKAPKKKQPIRYGACFVARSGDQYLIETRPEKGLLGGMIGFAGTDWTSNKPTAQLDAAPIKADWVKASEPVKHIFTHFELRLEVYGAEVENVGSNQMWVGEETLKGLPTVFKKVLRVVRG